MNPVLILTRNCLELTKKCVASVLTQDVPTEILVIDNGSTDCTLGWLYDERIPFIDFNPQVGVSAGWNIGLAKIFAASWKYDHAFVVNNDTILPTHFCRSLLACDAPFVTGASCENMDEVMQPPVLGVATDGPDFSAFLIRREAWEKIGPFDERMKLYASDCDYHVRAHSAGIWMVNSHVKFYHERSSTLKLAADEDRAAIQKQADADRAVFESIYGCLPGDEWYGELFK